MLYESQRLSMPMIFINTNKCLVCITKLRQRMEYFISQHPPAPSDIR